MNEQPDAGSVQLMASADVGPFLDVLGLLERSGVTDAVVRELCGPAGRHADHMARTSPDGQGLIVDYRQADDG